MNCGCEYGEFCTKVSVCFMEQRVSDEKHDLQEIIDDHAEFVRAVWSLLNKATHKLNTSAEVEADNAIWDGIRLCDAELAKEQPK